jgi:hypothetical protein
VAENWRDPSWSGFRQQFVEALVFPVRALLKPGKTVRKAHLETAQLWFKLYQDAQFDWYLRKLPGRILSPSNCGAIPQQPSEPEPPERDCLKPPE